MSDNEADRLPQRLRVYATRLANALVALVSEDPTMTAQLVKTFLTGAADEGLTLSALAARTGFSSTMAVRHIQDLGNINRHGSRGLELVVVAQRAHGDRRERQLFLSDRGKAVFRQMKINFEKGPTWRVLPLRKVNTGGP